MRSCEQTTCGAFIAISISFMSRPLHSLTQLEPRREDVSIQALQKKKKAKHKTWGLWQVSALTNLKKEREKEEEEGGGASKKCSFNCRTSIKASKWGRLEGTLAHQTDTPNTHHLYSRPLKKRKIKVSADEKGPFPAFIPPHPTPHPIHPLPLLLN